MAEHCATCGAETTTDGACPACMLDRGLMGAESPGQGALPIRSFGDYELLEEIARGGMGVVYRARQTSLNRIVAIKMVLAGKLAKPIDLQRFKAEAETAARLQHPNIVAIHEVGDVEGQPFFSMDYVEGQSLAELAHKEPLPARRAATYLKTIAEAVGYAHSKGVLHRDLKPSNILIDHNDQPRITDFGLAKRLTQNSDLATLTSDLTITGQVLGSPNFMPPEQAAGKHRELTPASDVYSLGALLYHLLTGRPPFLAENLPATLRLVAETEPVAPRLLAPAVPRDLETICLKCLEKELSRRYSTAQALAEDVNRFLRNEPILARPAGVISKVHRWCLRNKPLAVAGTVILGLLVVVAVGSLIAAFRINRERLQARASQNKAEVFGKFLSGTLASAGPSVARGRDKTLMMEILDNAARRVRKELTNQPEVEADVRLLIGKTYEDLGQYTNALAMTEEALRLREACLGPKHPAVAEALNNIGAILSDMGQIEAAEARDREALNLRKEIFGDESLEVALSMNNLGFRLWNRSDYAGAETMHRGALKIRLKKLGRAHPDVAMSLNNLGMALWARGEFDSGEANFREALGVFQETLGTNHPAVATMLNNLGTMLRDLGRLDEAEMMARKAWTMRERLLGARHSLTAYSQDNLAIVLHRLGRLDEAEELHRAALATYPETVGTNHQYVSESLSDLAVILARKGDFVAAEAMQRDALAVAERALGAENPNSAEVLDQLALLVAIRGELAAAAQMLTNALAIARKFSGAEHPDTISPLIHLAWVLKQKGDLTTAESLHNKANGISLKAGDYGARALTESIYDVANLLQAQRKFSESEPLLSEAWGYLESHPTGHKALERGALECLARLYEAWDRAAPNIGKSAVAASWRKKVEALENPAPSRPTSPL